MTTKELLYLEDALGHEKHFQTKCKETANQIQDAELKACVEQRHRSTSRFSKASIACFNDERRTNMDDKNLMENILLLEKGGDLFMRGTIESPTTDVHQAFSSALNDALCMQDTIYDKMAAKKLVSYRAGSAEPIKFCKTKIRFTEFLIRKTT